MSMFVFDGVSVYYLLKYVLNVVSTKNTMNESETTSNSKCKRVSVSGQ